jgi:selenocysteine-specific elongation factor
MKHIVVGTAGHIDHGKSSLVLALTGIDPDRLKEEKARGITIELGFAHTTIGDVNVAFVDVPGHERFVKTMLAGAGGLDCVLLVVAADESVMPQTREHFDICRLLQVQQGLIVLTKSDLADSETMELVRMEVRELVAGSFLEQAPVVPVSARTGDGLDQLRTALADIAAQLRERRDEGAARLPIDRAFTIQGFGTVVTGTLVAGTITTEDELVLLPGDTRVRVRGVQVHGKRRNEANAGQRTAINLGGIEVGEISRGQTLASPGSITVSRRVDALLDLLPGARPLRQGARVHFHQGTSEVLGRVSIAGPQVAQIEPGSLAAVRVRLESPAALTRGDRFIVRAYSPTVTIGGGEVLDPDPPRAGVRTAAAAARFAALSGGAQEALTQMVRDAGGQGVALAAVTSRAGVPPANVAATAAALETSGHARRVVDRLVASGVLAEATRRLLALVTEYHQAHPLADGLPREEARERIFAAMHPAVFDVVVGDLTAAGKLAARDRLALPGHRLELSPEEQRAREIVEGLYRRSGLKPPDAATIIAEGRLTPAVAERITALLLRQKQLARIDTLIFHAEALATLKSEIQGLKAIAPGGRATVDVATFKDRFGVSRKFAIPLLEWLDRERVTRRMGETRVVL